MMGRRRRNVMSVQDYRELAGMSKPNKAKSSRAGSVRSMRTEKTDKTDKSMKSMGREEVGLADLCDVINKDAECGLGDTILDNPIPTELQDKSVYKQVMDGYDQEERKIQEWEEKLKRRQVLIDRKKELAKKRRQVEAQAWAQKLQLQEEQLDDQEEYVRLTEREVRIRERQREMQKKASEMKAKELEEQLPEVQEDSESRTRNWVDLTRSVQDEVKVKSKSIRGGPSGAEGEMLNRGEMQAPLGEGRNTGQKVGNEVEHKIMELQTEIERLKSVDSRVATLLDKPQAIAQLKQLGMMPVNMMEEMLTFP